MSSPPASPPTAAQRRPASPPKQEERESSISRLVIAPISFLSFLLSLFLIDSYSTSSRRRDHAPKSPGGWFSSLLWRPKPGSPYAYVGGGKGGKEGEEWVWHTKQRKMLRMEVVDAFELRRWVVGVMGAVVLVFGGMGLWVGRWILGRWGW